MSIRRWRGRSEWALLVALVLGAGVLARASDEPAGETADTPAATEDRVIQIGPARGESETNNSSGEQQGDAAAPAYWIGLLGGPVSDELLHHIDLPEGQGLLIREIVPGSPAEKAGLQQWDIMLRANETDLSDMRDLVDLVIKAGGDESAIAIEVLRHGSRETIHVTPEERPENVAVGGGQFGPGGFPGIMPGQDPRALLQMFERGLGPDGQQFEFRNFGPRGLGGHGLQGMPSGVSIQVHKEGDKAARVTVERGGETWEVTADDPESLEKLPEDLRPFVRQMLQGEGGANQFVMPNLGGAGMPADINERLEEMERRMMEMQKRFLESQDKVEESK